MLIKYEFDPEIGMYPVVASEPETDIEVDPFLEDFPVTEEDPIEDTVEPVYVGLTYDDLVTFYKDYLAEDLDQEVSVASEPVNFFQQSLESLSSTDTLLLIVVILLLAQLIRNFMGGIFS